MLQILFVCTIIRFCIFGSQQTKLVSTQFLYKFLIMSIHVWLKQSEPFINKQWACWCICVVLIVTLDSKYCPKSSIIVFVRIMNTIRPMMKIFSLNFRNKWINWIKRIKMSNWASRCYQILYTTFASLKFGSSNLV